MASHVVLLTLLICCATPCLAETLRAWSDLAVGENTCDVRRPPWAAIGDNKTDDTVAIQLAIRDCHSKYPDGAVVVLSGPATYRISASIALASNLTLLVGANTSLFSAQPVCDPHAGAAACTQNRLCPTLYWQYGPTAVLCGTNLTNVAVVGMDKHSSKIDGGGWPWYAAGIANASMQGQGPRLYELAWSRNLTLSQISFVNSPSWTIHPTFSNGVLAEHIQILNPRFTPNTDGFDPDSSSNVVLRDSLIDTGDDGISIKSSNSSEPGSRHIMMPARNIHIYRTIIKSRNFCVGSNTFGGVYDLLMEDCEIGDDDGSSPWAIKYKSHQTYPGTMKNHTYRRIRVGNIQSNSYQQPHAGYFMSIELRYHPLIPNRTCQSWNCPVFEDISFEDIAITGAERAGDINGFKGDLLQGLRFKNVTFQTKPKHGWTCGYVNLTSFEATSVEPPLACSTGVAQLPSAPQMPMEAFV